MKRLDRKYAAFELPDGFILEIIGDGSFTDYYIGHKDCCIRSHYFGVPAPFDECLNELENARVGTYYSVYMEAYRKEYMDE